MSETANWTHSQHIAALLLSRPHICNFRWNGLIASRTQWFIGFALEMEVPELCIRPFDFFPSCKLRSEITYFFINLKDAGLYIEN